MTSSHDFNDTPDWDALARHRAGECAPDEARRVAAWLAEHPLDDAMIAALDAAVGAHFGTDDMSAQPVNVEGALGRLHQRMNESAPAAPRLTVARGGAPNAPQKWQRHRVLGGLAAAAAIAAIAFVLNRQASSVGTVTTNVASTAGATHQYRTAVGIVDSVTLSDGTLVLLAPSSHLTVPAAYGTASREVQLEGVARFSVHHDAAVPFSVHAGNAIVRDIGTRFTVRVPTDEAGQTTTVAVSEGQVSLASSATNAPPTDLSAGDRGEIGADGAVHASRAVVRDDDEAWTRGVLSYNAAPLALVRDDLMRWYGLDLQVDDTMLSTRRLTATFEKQDPDQLLRTLGLALGMSVRRSGNTVTLRPGAIGQ